MALLRPDRRRALRAAMASCAGVALPVLSVAQAWPARPIRLICPFPAGGPTDVVMRALAGSAAVHLGQQVFVENRPGASGTLGPIELAAARPDGYTLGQLPFTVFRVPHTQKVQFDTQKDFTWIICLTGYTFGIVVPADSPIRSIRDVVDYARDNPGKFTYGCPGIGGTPHMAMEEFAMRAGIKLAPIPFKGNPENMQALLGGHIMAASDAAGWGPYVDSGKVRLLATYGSRRTKRWPQAPTLLELGYQTVSDSPFGICGPKGMDAAVTRTIHDGFRKTLVDPAVIEVFDKYDQSTIYMDTATYTRWASETFVAEKETIERLGLAPKN